MHEDNETEPVGTPAEEPDRFLFEFTTGVKLRIRKKYPTLPIMQAIADIPEPQPPLGPDGNPNPLDPDFVRAIENLERERNEVLNQRLIYLATKVEHLPEDIPGPESDEIEWDIVAVHGRVPKTREERYYQWVQVFACSAGVGALQAQTEYLLLIHRLLEISGLMQEGALRVMSTFPNVPGRGTDAGSATAEGDTDPDRSGRDGGYGVATGDGGAGADEPAPDS